MAAVSRRAVLAALAATPAASGAASARAASAALPAVADAGDPVLPLYRDLLRLIGPADAAHAESVRLRAALVARWGELGGRQSGGERWGHDPDFPALDAAIERCDAYTDARTDLVERILATEPTSLAGLLCKVRTGLGAFPEGEALRPQFHEHAAWVALADAERMLRHAIGPHDPGALASAGGAA